MSVGFTVKSQVVLDMNRMDERGVITRGEVNFREYQAPRARMQELMLVGVTDTYEHTSTYQGTTTTRTVVDVEIEVLKGRDKGVRFRQPWVTVSVDERSHMGQIWRAVGLPVPGPGSNALITDLLRKPFMGRIEHSQSGNGEITYAKVVAGSIGPVDDDEDDADPAPATRPATRSAPPTVSGDTAVAAADDPFSEDDDEVPF